MANNKTKLVSIFGTGTYGKSVYQDLTRHGYEVVNFYDNDKSKHNTKIFDILVLDPSAINKETPQIIIASTWHEEIKKQLEEIGYEDYSYSHILGYEDLYHNWKSSKKHSKEGLEFFQTGGTNGIELKLDKRKWKIPKLISNSSEPWARELTEIYLSPVSFPASLSPSAGELYRSLILNIGPKIIVEIGIFMGGSTIWAGSAILDSELDSKIHSIDLFNNENISQDHQKFVQERVSNAGLDKYVTLHKLNSSAQIDQFIPYLNGEKIDFLFIDGDHFPRGASLDFIKYTKYLSSGGYILLHDIFPEYCGWEGPAFVIDNLIKNDDSFELIQIYTTPQNY